jgi:uncharacterized protein (UPF0548 family)
MHQGLLEAQLVLHGLRAQRVAFERDQPNRQFEAARIVLNSTAMQQKRILRITRRHTDLSPARLVYLVLVRHLTFFARLRQCHVLQAIRRQEP